MQALEIHGLPTLRDISIDRCGTEIATFKGDAGILQLRVAVGQRWRELNPGAQYVVFVAIEPAQGTLPGADEAAGETAIDYEELDRG